MRALSPLLFLLLLAAGSYAVLQFPNLAWVRSLERAALGWARADLVVRDSVLAAVDTFLLGRETELASAKLLSAGEKRTLLRSPYRHHLAAARSLGVVTDPSRDLVTVPRESRYFLAPWSQQRLAPAARAVLDTLGAHFAAEVDRSGLPPARFTVTSTYRDSSHQARLRKTNRYAARGTSSHEFGASFDISLQRFSPGDPEDDAAAFTLDRAADPRIDEPLAARLSRAIRERERRWASATVAAQTARYDAALGRALLRLASADRLYALREEGPGCYHVTAR